jgi:hypothetical protein
VQAGSPDHRKLRRLRAGVVSVAFAAASVPPRTEIEQTSLNKPLTAVKGCEEITIQTSGLEDPVRQAAGRARTAGAHATHRRRYLQGLSQSPAPPGFLDDSSWVIPRIESVEEWLDEHEAEHAGLTSLQEEFKKALERGEPGTLDT